MGNALYVERRGAPAVRRAQLATGVAAKGGGDAAAANGAAAGLRTVPAAPAGRGGAAAVPGALLRLYEVRAGSAGITPEPLPLAGGEPLALTPTSAYVAIVLRSVALAAAGADEAAGDVVLCEEQVVEAISPRGLARSFVGRSVVAADGSAAALSPDAPRCDYRVYVLNGVQSSPVARALALTAALQAERELLAAGSVCASLLGVAGAPSLDLVRLPQVALHGVDSMLWDLTERSADAGADDPEGSGADGGAAVDMDTDGEGAAGDSRVASELESASSPHAHSSGLAIPPPSAGVPRLGLSLGSTGDGGAPGPPSQSSAPAGDDAAAAEDDDEMSDSAEDDSDGLSDSGSDAGGSDPLRGGDAGTAQQTAGGGPAEPPLVSNRPPSLSLSLGRAAPPAPVPLDLGSVGRGGAEKTEAMRKKEKMAHFAGHCSRVAPGLHVSGEAVARDRAALDACGITHVVNCVGFVCPECHAPDLRYKTLWLQDTPDEDISSLLYEVFDFIAEAHAEGGTVLVHCTHGVSRSASFAIGYEMWRTGASYDDQFRAVKELRGVVNPNVGFACQLLQWGGRREGKEPPSAARVRVLRIAPHSEHDPLLLVPKGAKGDGTLDPRGAFVVLPRGGSAVYVWVGEGCPPQFEEAADLAAQRLVKYEGLPAPTKVHQGANESEDLKAALRAWGGAGAEGAAGADAAGARARAEWDTDFELFRKGLERGTPAMPGCGGGAGAPPPSEVPLYAMLASRQRSAGNMTAAAAARAHAHAGVPAADAPPALARTTSEGSALLGGSGGPQTGLRDSAQPPSARRNLSLGHPTVSAEGGEGAVADGRARRWGGSEAGPGAEEASAPHSAPAGARLYTWPDMEELKMFDGDDLEPGGVFLLFAPVGGDEDEGGDGTPLCTVWVGGDADPEEVPAASEAAEACARTLGLEQVPRSRLVEDGDEPDSFWETIDGA